MHRKSRKGSEATRSGGTLPRSETEGPGQFPSTSTAGTSRIFDGFSGSSGPPTPSIPTVSPTSRSRRESTPSTNACTLSPGRRRTGLSFPYSKGTFSRSVQTDLAPYSPVARPSPLSCVDPHDGGRAFGWALPLVGNKLAASLTRGRPGAEPSSVAPASPGGRRGVSWVGPGRRRGRSSDGPRRNRGKRPLLCGCRPSEASRRPDNPAAGADLLTSQGTLVGNLG